MDIIMKKPLTLAVGIALAALSSVSYADNDSRLIIKDEANSAHVNFFIERSEITGAEGVPLLSVNVYSDEAKQDIEDVIKRFSAN